MTRIRISVALLFFVSTAFAQEPPGTITGTLSDPDGIVSDATVEARNQSTDAVSTTVSSQDGFTLSELPAGTYEISVPPLGWRTVRFVQPDVVVVAGETVRLDIELERDNLGVVGDDAAFLAIRNRYAGLTGPTPRTADGRPDLGGVWQGNFDPSPETPAALPWAVQLVDERKANFGVDSPGAACLPNPVPSSPVLYKFLQSPSLLVQLFEYQPHYRQVFLDQDTHPEDLDPTWTGHSIGRWEGDTLVVDTIGFNDRSWLPQNYPHTEQLHIIERFSRPDLARLNVDVTIEDPGTFTEPWELHMVWALAPNEELMEYLCNENNQYLKNIDIQ
jgi:hypothetical protein